MHWSKPYAAPSLTEVWQQQLKDILAFGLTVSPRGMETRELPNSAVAFDMMYPVLNVPRRKLQTKFLAGEAYWILSGDDSVAGIAPYNPNISRFSDDGVTFHGAYGPKIVAQLPYVVKKLHEDPMSRQAGLNIWRESPPHTKDVPCTVSMFFNIRDGKLHSHVYMRSSDAWLGLPYDAFNFTMVACQVIRELNELRYREGALSPLVPGTLFLTMASSHLYAEHFEVGGMCTFGHEAQPCNPLPEVFYRGVFGEVPLLSLLAEIRDSDKDSPARFWHVR